MKQAFLAAAIALLALPLAATNVSAETIERACLKSDRQGANRALCGCIQQVADMTLRGGDQRRAAKFFTDPEEAQKVRLSDRDSDNDFWDRYKAFGESAQTFCAG